MSSPYDILPPREPIGITDRATGNVTVTRNWWRFFNNLFFTAGSGQAQQTLVQVIENQTQVASISFVTASKPNVGRAQVSAMVYWGF